MILLYSHLLFFKPFCVLGLLSKPLSFTLGPQNLRLALVLLGLEALGLFLGLRFLFRTHCKKRILHDEVVENGENTLTARPAHNGRTGHGRMVRVTSVILLW